MNPIKQKTKNSLYLVPALALACLPATQACHMEPESNDALEEVLDMTEVLVGPTAPLGSATPTTFRPRGVIDLAICLDTSGSMDGLIESAKQKLWAVVNDFALVDPVPVLRVALLTFGNDGHSEENGWVRVDAPLTGDLDLISQRLFALTTNGGTELVGRVVNTATSELEWSNDPKALKLLIVAGNESADQDAQFGFRDASRRAIAQGIMVNAIYCGDPLDEFAPDWREVSKLADGQFASIDANNGTVVISTPFDAELQALTAKVNLTYIPMGASGREGWANQRTQDANNAALSEAAGASRAMTKNGQLYVCGWDLVDACRIGTLKLEDVKPEDLPNELQALSSLELTAFVESKAAERMKIQAHISAVGVKRDAWLMTERERLQVDDSKAFDRVLRDSIRNQAASRGFLYKGADAPATQPAQGSQSLAPGCQE
ncbi:MAG: vWA domain-containing protein [bacterium]|nr:VWA domain-containing protein [Planctomycetota bacterium]HIL51169.1 VWA domain-containing protein [Planctomycetota bacterium]